MSPKNKFTKEQILGAGIEIIRMGGAEKVTARELGKYLGCSSQPLFSHFKSMEDYKNELLEEVKKIYLQYLSLGLSGDKPFKGAGMQYIKFADEEPNLFKFLFMTKRECDVVMHVLPQNSFDYHAVLSSLETTHNISHEKAESIYNHLSVYTYGLAVLFAGKTGIFTMKDADLMLTEMFLALKEAENDGHN